MAGAGWQALGAAITNGMGAFGQRQHDILAEKQALLQQQLLQDQVNELPQKHAEGDLAHYTTQYGDDRFNNPGFLAAAKAAGLTIPTKPLLDLQRPRVAAVENGLGGEIPSTAQVASGMGVAPDTGAVLPSEVALKQKLDAQHSAQAGFVTDYMKSLSGTPVEPAPPLTGKPSSGMSGLPAGRTPEVPFESPAAERKRVMGKLTGMDTGAGQHESLEHIAAREKQAAELKSHVPPAMLQRVTGQMGTMVDNLSVAQRELEKMYPGIEKAVQIGPDGKDVGSGAYNGTMDLLKAKAHRMLYNYSYTPYNKAIQAASLANVTGWGTLVPGRINSQIVDKLKEHQSAFGNETPLATYQRNKELIDMTGRNRQELLNAGQPMAGQSTSPQDMVVPPPAGTPPIQIQGNPFPESTAPTVPRTQLKAGDAIPMAEVIARAQKSGIDPKVAAARLVAEGVKVIK